MISLLLYTPNTYPGKVGHVTLDWHLL